MRKNKKLPKELIIEKEYPFFSILILGTPWQVRLLNKQEILGEHKFDLKGCCCYSEYIIDLCYEGSLFVLEQTFYHEIAHSLTAHNIGSKDDALETINEEIMANSIGDGIAQLLRQDYPFHPKYSDKQKAKQIKDLLQAEYV